MSTSPVREAVDAAPVPTPRLRPSAVSPARRYSRALRQEREASAALLARAEAAERECEELRAQRDASVEQRGAALQQLQQLSAAKQHAEAAQAQLAMQLSAASDGQASLHSRTHAAEVRCGELLRQQEGTHGARAQLEQQRDEARPPRPRSVRSV